MNKYETVCIVRPDLAEDAVKGIIAKATASLESAGGTVARVDEWGRRKLAYPIQKKNEGYYFVLDYTSSPEGSKEVERLLRLNEDVLRYQTIRIIATKQAEKPAEAAVSAPAEVAEVKAEGGQANG